MFNKLHLEMIDTTSKMSLKMSCLKACDNNVAKARELYDFLLDGVESIPDVEPVRPGGFEQVKQGVSDVFSWVESHRDDIAQGVSFIQSLRKSAPAPQVDSNIPPIPKP